MLTMFPTLRRITDQKQVDALKVVAATDNHGVLAATHLVERDGEIVGYASIGGIPYLNCWLHSEKLHARDSLVLLNMGEVIIANSGGRAILLPCAENSPFYPYIEKLGYKRLGPTTLNLKDL